MKISGIFVPVVITIALITTIAWLISGHSFDFALSCGISVLVISCPCAVVLATPTAVVAAVAAAARLGIFEIKQQNGMILAFFNDFRPEYASAVAQNMRGRAMISGARSSAGRKSATFSFVMFRRLSPRPTIMREPTQVISVITA